MKYEFLLHAMLGLGASHLGLLTPTDYNKVALKHRVTAIRELNSHLSQPNISKSGGEAAFAAILVLTFQSSYMADGMVDFLTMVRGCKFPLGLVNVSSFIRLACWLRGGGSGADHLQDVCKIQLLRKDKGTCPAGRRPYVPRCPYRQPVLREREENRTLL